MSKNIFVGNLAFETTSDDLRIAFEAHGVVTSAEVLMDRETGKPRGFGFVEMSNGADQAIKALNLTPLCGRNITVNEARPRETGGRGRSGGRRY